MSSIEKPAGYYDEEGGTCTVCGGGTRYGSRHGRCGAAVMALERERDALQKFKSFVHDFLDRVGVPVDPPGEHRDAGCRIGQRLEYLVAERDALRAARFWGY